jgi:hypothetical protein
VRNVDLSRELEVLCYHIGRVSDPEQNPPNDVEQ